MQWTECPSPNDPILFDSRGQRRTASLFKEVTQDKNMPPIFTMRDYDWGGYISLYNLYMESIDEADAAMRAFGSLAHWRKLTRCKWFQSGSEEHGFPGLDQWRKDMAMRDATTAKKTLVEAAERGDLRAATKILDYSTKGDLAGVEDIAKPKRTPSRRSDTKDPEVVDFNSILENLQES